MVSLVAAMHVGPARSDDTGAACGGAHAGGAVCHFIFRGFPLRVSADAPGAVAVRAVFMDADHRELAVVECAARATPTASCRASVPDGGSTIEQFWLGQAIMRCHVEGDGAGRYSCMSGSGR